jgi:DNA polymerase-3 subunit epsilon|tara:strand:- start:7702 stop:8433 length:732 start_codon:yes stop_codon:yes gene_type:complete
MRQVVLDTETTGLEPDQDHRIIEIGCIELIDRKITRRTFQRYINPERDSDDGALEVHGLSRQFLADKPLFVDVWEDFFDFVRGAELVIHNAAFDVAFINYEMSRLADGVGKIEDFCSVVDSLEIARTKHPGQKNSLDALCRRYSVDNSQRELHGALLDAEILADVFLLLTGGQVNLALGEGEASGSADSSSGPRRLTDDRPPLLVIKASKEEIRRHEEKLVEIEKVSGGSCVWRDDEVPATGS